MTDPVKGIFAKGFVTSIREDFDKQINLLLSKFEKEGCNVELMIRHIQDSFECVDCRLRKYNKWKLDL